MSASNGESGNVGYYRRRAGAMELIALHDGGLSRPFMPGFVRNVDDATVGEAQVEAGLPRDQLTLTFSPLLVRAGDRTVLIDTGFGTSGPPTGGRTIANMRAAGVEPDAVTDVIISHFHSDHLAGLATGEGGKAFPRATVHVPRPEMDFWMAPGRREQVPEMVQQQLDTALKVLGPLQSELHQFNWGDEIVPGFRAVDAKGHTPGMTAVEIGSGDSAVLYMADVTNNPLLFARHPTWQAVFDFDPDQAVQTRQRLLREAATNHRMLYFFHATFPCFGTVVQSGDGFEYLPAHWS